VGKYARVSITLPEEMLAAVDRRGVREMRNRSEVIREALRHYLRLGLAEADDGETPAGTGGGKRGRAAREALATNV
jgi:metal-responsive CopG/Arc/MetJ family transcriptional regulator